LVNAAISCVDKQVGGRSHGLNAADFRHHGDKPGRYRIRSGDTFNWK
jgi:hypothetical protein